MRQALKSDLKRKLSDSIGIFTVSVGRAILGSGHVAKPEPHVKGTIVNGPA